MSDFALGYLVGAAVTAALMLANQWRLGLTRDRQ